jgi:hypothetical protein
MSRSIVRLKAASTMQKIGRDHINRIWRHPECMSIGGCSESSNESDKTICQLSEEDDSDSSDTSQEDSDAEEHTIATSFFGNVSILDAMTYLFTSYDESESLDTFDESEKCKLISSSSNCNDSESGGSDQSSQQEAVSFYDDWLRRKGKKQLTGDVSSSDESCGQSRIPADETSELTVEDSDEESEESSRINERQINSHLDGRHRLGRDHPLKRGRTKFPKEIIIEARVF